MSEQEESAYFQKMVDNIPAFQELRRDIEKEKLRAEAIAHYTRFLRLSYYMTGK